MPKGEGEKGRNKKNAQRFSKKAQGKRTRSSFRARAFSDFTSSYFRRIKLSFKKACQRFDRKRILRFLRPKPFLNKVTAPASPFPHKQKGKLSLKAKEQNYRDLIVRLRVAAHAAKKGNTKPSDVEGLIHHNESSGDLPLCCRFSSKCHILSHKIIRFIKRIGLLAKLALLSIHVLIRFLCLRMQQIWMRSIQGMLQGGRIAQLKIIGGWQRLRRAFEKALQKTHQLKSRTQLELQQYHYRMKQKCVGCIHGVRQCWRVFVEKIKNTLLGLQGACKKFLRSVNQFKLALLILFSQLLQRTKKRAVQSLYLTEQCWQILVTTLKKAWTSLADACRHCASIIKKFKLALQTYFNQFFFRIRERAARWAHCICQCWFTLIFKIKKTGKSLRSAHKSSMRAVKRCKQNILFQIRQYFLGVRVHTLHFLNRVHQNCWRTPVLKIKRTQLRLQSACKSFIASVLQCKHAFVQLCRREIQRIKKAATYCIYLARLCWYVPICKMKKAWYRLQKAREHCIHSVKKCKQAARIRFNQQLIRIKKNSIACVEWVPQCWRRCAFLVKRMGNRLQQANKNAIQTAVQFKKDTVFQIDKCIYRLWITVLRFLYLIEKKCWRTPLFKMKRTWRHLQRVRRRSIRTTRELAKRTQFQIRWYLHGVWLNTLRFQERVQQICWNTPLFKIKRAKIRFLRTCKSGMRAAIQFKKHTQFQIHNYLHRVQLNCVRFIGWVQKICWHAPLAKIKKAQLHLQRARNSAIRTARQLQKQAQFQIRQYLYRIQLKCSQFIASVHKKCWHIPILKIKRIRIHLQRVRKSSFRFVKQFRQSIQFEIRRHLYRILSRCSRFLRLVHKDCWHIPVVKVKRSMPYLRNAPKHVVQAASLSKYKALLRFHLNLQRLRLQGVGFLYFLHQCWILTVLKTTRAFRSMQAAMKGFSKWAKQSKRHAQLQLHLYLLRIKKRAARFSHSVYQSRRMLISVTKRWKGLVAQRTMRFSHSVQHARRILVSVAKRGRGHIAQRAARFSHSMLQNGRKLTFLTKRFWRHVAVGRKNASYVMNRVSYQSFWKQKYAYYRTRFLMLSLKKSFLQLQQSAASKINRMLRSFASRRADKIQGIRRVTSHAASHIQKQWERIADTGQSEIQWILSRDWKKWVQQIPRRREIVLTCLLIVLFLPVLFFKAVRNSFYSMLTQNATQNSIGKSEHFAFQDGLLCFNEGLRPSFAHSFETSTPDSGKNSWSLKVNADASANKIPTITQPDPIASLPNPLLAAATDLFSSNSAPSDATSLWDAGKGEWLPQRVFLSNVQETDDGFGNVRNYWTLDVLVAPLFKPGRILPLLDVRWHEFSDDRESNRFAANVGLMARYIPESRCAPLIGANLYYDYRHSTIDKGWNRWGAGMEVLGKRWDFRLNGYFPIGDKLHMHKCTFDDFEGDFTMTQRKYEFMYTGFNADIGCRGIVTKNWQVYLTGGTYYLKGDCHFSAWGFRMGIRPQFKDYIALDLSVSHDHIFETVYQGQIIFSLPLYGFGAQKNKKGPCGITQRQIYQPVERFDIIPVSRVCCWDQNF